MIESAFLHPGLSFDSRTERIFFMPILERFSIEDRTL